MDDHANDTSGRDETPARDSGLHERMTWIGDQIPVHPSGDDLIGIERTAGRRTRRRRVMAGLIGAGVLVAGAFVAVDLVDGDDDGSDSIALTADEPEPPAEEEQGTGAAEDDDASTSESEGDEVEPPTDPADDAVAADGDDGVGTVTAIDAASGSTTMATAERTTVENASAAGDRSDARIVAWQDGFLSVETRYAAQPLPTDFSEEITALFPEEVIDLIQSAQPTTIEEATTLLSEAGLLGEVTSVLSEHPEASDAIYSIERPQPETIARISRDGLEWEQIDFDPPVTEWYGGQEVHSDGSRLVLWETVFTQPPEPVDPTSSLFEPSALQAVRFVTTTDLVNWEVIDVPVASPGSVPEFFFEMAFPSSVAVEGDRFVLEIDWNRQPDLTAMFADELAERPETAEMGMGASTDGTGVTLELYSAEGVGIERITRTWAELGIDPLTEEEFYRGRRTTQVGSFDGTLGPSSEIEGYGTVVGVDGAGFLRIGVPSFFSVDGVEWAEIDTLGGGGSPVGLVLQHEGRVIAFASAGPEEPGVPFELDLDDLLWRPTDGPTVPANSYPSGGGPAVVSSAVLYQVSPPYDPEPFEATATIEVDGYVVTQTQTHRGEGYTLARDGVEIVSEYVEWAGDVSWGEDGPFEHRRFENDGSVITDPDTGEDLVTITNADMSELWMQLERSIPVDETWVEPETRLLATDGERWLDEQISSSVVHDQGEVLETMPRWPTGVAVNGGVVLVGFSDGSIDRFEF